MNKALLVDRDGVLLESVPDYVKSIEEIRFIPGVEAAVARLWSKGYILCVVTNQAGIGKKLYNIETLQEIHFYIQEKFYEHGRGIVRWYVCPHTVEDKCSCRKPSPALLQQAIQEFTLDPSHTWMVGDKKSDIEAGKKAGCKTCIVKTGEGQKQIFSETNKPDLVVNSFVDFVDTMLV
ncbi:MAG: HAD family hydrolase [Candidatus Brocadiae bacterium]|nr:HAD family hydrolase [Candidatus Brocadiia bacterium]